MSRQSRTELAIIGLVMVGSLVFREAFGLTRFHMYAISLGGIALIIGKVAIDVYREDQTHEQ